MGEVFTMADYRPVNPKTVKGYHEGQQFTLRFNPNAKTPTEQWCWEVRIVHVYPFYGCAANETKALKDAKKEIDFRTGNKKVV